MQEYKQLRRNLKLPGIDRLPMLRVALLGDTATQSLSIALRGMAIERGYRLDLYEADYNQVEQQVLDPTSELHCFAPDYIFLFQSTHKLGEAHSLMNQSERESLASRRLAFVAQCCQLTSARVVCLNYPVLDDAIFGSYANHVPSSLTYQVRLLNVGLMQLTQQHANLFICDIEALNGKLGRDQMFAANQYITTDMILSISALPYVASRVMDVITAIQGKAKKCLIMDLDNTLWGGVIGDDGMEGIQLGHGLGIGKAFSELQMWIKKLRDRGIILCVCSKNDEAVAKEPFLHHPDMVLRLSDIAVFMANWETKVDNIRAIQQVLNIGFDSMVFIDDNPFERNMVREHIPGITVPELPEDPGDYLEYLYGENLFETASFDDADRDRTAQYQVEAERVSLAKSFTCEQDFLRSLQMVSTVSGFTRFNTPRVAQLTQRSNQFNLRTVRYTEADIAAFAADPDIIDLAFTLEDRFGDNGLIAVIVMRRTDAQTLFIDTWLMSCRVLKRGMEQFTLSQMVLRARQAGYRYLVGEYLPTAKNNMVSDLYQRLGFTPIEGAETARFSLDTESFINIECNITTDNSN